MRFWSPLLFVAVIGCQPQSESDSWQYPTSGEIVGLATPVQLGSQLTEFYPSDYFYSTPDSVNWPEGLSAVWNADLGTYTLMGGDELAMQSSARFWFNGESYDLIIRRSRKVPLELRVPRTAFEGPVMAFGSFNAWNRTADTMVSEDDDWVFRTEVQPGLYEYKFYQDNTEFLDPNNERTVGNGMGGENSVVEVEARGTAPQAIVPLNVSDKGVLTVQPLPESQSFSVMIDNHILSAELIQKSSSGIWEVAIPTSLRQIERATVRLFSANESGWAQEVRIPLHYGVAVHNASKLDRSDWASARMYFMMVDRFANGDTANDQPLNQPDVLTQADFMGGDVNGILRELQTGYFDSLGINTLWLSPITDGPDDAWGLWDKGGVRTKFSAYHGYWPVSNTRTDNHFTTAEVLHQLLDSAHAKDYNVVLDYVANHIHINHPLYKEHPDWATDLYLPDGTLNTEKWDEHRLTTWFDNHLPTLDLRKPEVVEPMTDSALYWLTEFDFDGFRHDATKHIDLLFWRTLTRKIKDRVVKENGTPVYQIGETYGSPELIASYINSGMLDAQFDFNAYDAIVAVLVDSNVHADRIVDVMNQSWDWYGQHNTMGYISGNQDRSRFISLASGDVSLSEDQKLAGYTREIGKPASEAYHKLALLHVFNHSIPGIPVIYYGDEYGSPGANDPDNRRMMKFGDLDEDEATLLAHVRELQRIRTYEMALVYGSAEIESIGEDVIHIQRSYLNETIDIYINTSNEAVEMNLPQSGWLYGKIEKEGELAPLTAVMIKSHRS